MSVNLNQEIWMYVEKLYIHCYGSDELKIFLNKFGVDYNNEQYFNLSSDGSIHPIPLYAFMSRDNYEFANFMQTIPTYKYLPILQQVVFDVKIIETRKDGWNYYGEAIRNWHPKIVEILRASGVKLDVEKKKLSSSEDEEDFGGPDFLPYTFNDLFLDYIRKEINESHKNGQLLATIILSRKLLEILIVRIFEVVFPKVKTGVYSEDSHKLWYDKKRKRYHFLETLLENLKLNAIEFHEDEDLIIETVNTIDKIRIEANKCVHRDYKIPDEQYIKTLKIESAAVSIRKIYKKYCNP